MERNSISVGGLWTDERAQTAQDFAIGISIFLLVVGAVFVYFPTLFTPYGQAIQGEDTSAQAERVGMLIVDGGDKRNMMTEEDIDRWFDDDDPEVLQEEAGLASTSQVNVTVSPLSPEESDPIELQDHGDAVVGHEYRGQDSSSVSRIVQIDDSEIVAADEGDVAYRLTVRVW